MDYYYISQLGIEQKHSLCWHFQSTVVNAEFIQTIASWFWILQLTRSFHWWTIPSIDYIFISVEYCNPELKKTTTLWFQVQLTRTLTLAIPKLNLCSAKKTHVSGTSLCQETFVLLRFYHAEKPLCFWDFIIRQEDSMLLGLQHAKRPPHLSYFNMPWDSSCLRNFIECLVSNRSQPTKTSNA